ncbi:hypothetical protein Landi51_12530 [Colletotrichum acutatum]
MASSDFNTQVLADQPSKKVQACDEVFKSIVKHPHEIPYTRAQELVKDLWTDFRSWISRLLDDGKIFDKNTPLTGLIALDRKISVGDGPEKAIFTHDLEVLCHYLQRTILLRGADNRLRGDEASRKDPLLKGSKTKIMENDMFGPRSDLGWYMFFGIPMRLLLIESESVMFSKDDEMADDFLSQIVGKQCIEGRLIDAKCHWFI